MLIEFYKLLEESAPEVTLELNESDAPERAAEEDKGTFFRPVEYNVIASNATIHRSALKFWKTDR